MLWGDGAKSQVYRAWAERNGIKNDFQLLSNLLKEKKKRSRTEEEMEERMLMQKTNKKTPKKNRNNNNSEIIIANTFGELTLQISYYFYICMHIFNIFTF